MASLELAKDVSSDDDTLGGDNCEDRSNEGCQDSAERVQESGFERYQHPRGVIEHFTKTLTSIQRKDLKHLYVNLLKEQYFQDKTPVRKVIVESLCELLQPLSNCKGFICMTNYELIFFYDMDTSSEGEPAKASTIFFFERRVAETRTYLKVISLSSIREIQRRLFLTQKTALEVFLTTNKSLLLNFPDTETRDQFAKKILRQRKTKCKNLKYYTSLDPKWILRKKELTEQWQNWKISNFEYLMQLN